MVKNATNCIVDVIRINFALHTHLTLLKHDTTPEKRRVCAAFAGLTREGGLRQGAGKSCSLKIRSAAEVQVKSAKKQASPFQKFNVESSSN